MSFELILPFLRPIEPLLLDERISEIMGNPDASWWYERDGIIHREAAVSFDADRLRTGLEVIANQLGKTKLTRKLALRRADKPNPLYYAQRTVDVASARLWLIEGVPMDDVVTMLQVRRRFEIPAALCSARAREIALMAERMIARRKIA